MVHTALMTARLPITTVGVARQHGAYRYTDEFGRPAAMVVDQVFATAGGREFIIPNVRWVQDEDHVGRVPRRLYDAETAGAAVEARGDIDPERWLELAPRPPLEEVFAEEAEREMYARAGYGGEPW